MSAGFTRGPWKIVPYYDGDSIVITEQDDNWRICFMATPGGSPDAWHKIQANARLIAAAPELYEALEAVTMFAAATIEKLKLVDTNGIIDAANTALAKVRGEQVSA